MAPSMEKTYSIFFAGIIVALFILYKATGLLGINGVLGSVVLGIGLISVILMLSFKGGSSKDSTPAMTSKLLYASAMILIGSFLLFANIAPQVIKQKFMGLIITIIGYFLAFKYQYVSDYQRSDFALTGAIIGFVIFIIGLYFLIF